MELGVMTHSKDHSERRVPFADFSSVDEDDAISLESVLQWDRRVFSNVMLHKNYPLDESIAKTGSNCVLVESENRRVRMSLRSTSFCAPFNCCSMGTIS